MTELKSAGESWGRKSWDASCVLSVSGLSVWYGVKVDGLGTCDGME